MIREVYKNGLINVLKNANALRSPFDGIQLFSTEIQVALVVLHFELYKQDAN